MLTIPKIFDDSVKQNTNECCFKMLCDGSIHSLSYEQVEKRVSATCVYLRENGIVPQDRVTLQGP